MADQATVEAILDLIGRMPGQKRALLALMEASQCARKGSDMDAELLEQAELATGFSVFGPVALRRLLEEAGALRYEPSEEELAAQAAAEAAEAEEADETELVEAASDESAAVDVLEVHPPAEGHWCATDEGLAALEATRESERGAGFELLDAEDGRYRELYGKILALCDDGPKTAAEIEKVTEADPVTADPHRFGSYFTQRLEQCGALSWAGGWSTTDFGRRLAEECAQAAAPATE